MNRFELRKIIVVGLLPVVPEGTLLAPDGMTPLVLPDVYPVRVRAVFWIPAAAPFKPRRQASEVVDARSFELEHLRAGAIVEVAEWLEFPESPTADELKRRLMPVWEGLAQAELGYVPNGVPLSPIAVKFTPTVVGVE